MKITYTKKGDYLFPDLVLEETDDQIGKYGMLRKSFLKEHRTGYYTSMMLSGKLNQHLAEIDRIATERYETMMKQFMSAENVDEKLKARDQMAWLRAVGNIQNRVEEIILSELIFQ